MLHLDTSFALGKNITPSHGIPDQDILGLRTASKRYTEDWLQERRNGEHAWSMDPYQKATIEQVKEVAAKAKKDGIQTVIWVGIGGSGLGPRVIQEMMEGPDKIEFIVLDTIDPSILNMYVDALDWNRTMITVVSKSGGTLETMSVFYFLWAELERHLKDKAADHVVAITDPETGSLNKFCVQKNIRMLPIPSGVGGRFSIFTPVGLLPLAFLGGDVDAFIRGAKEMDDLCQQNSLDENPAMMLAVMQYLLDTKRDYPIRVIMPYTQRFASISRWNQQLIAESLGKTETQNPIPLAAVGTQDQHSLLQQWMQGPRKQWHLFLREEEKPRLTMPEKTPAPFEYLSGKAFSQILDACHEGTSRALAEAKRPSITLTITRLDEYHAGHLFFFLMAEVVFLGKLYRIDPYGQPGVEAGKTITKDILSHGRS